MVYSYVNSIGKVTPFRDRRPGHDWVLNFERRHYGKLRKKRRKSLSKVTASEMSKENVDDFYTMFNNILTKYNLHNKPWQILNIDETDLTSESTEQMVYVSVGIRNA